jgi:superfamily I DNA and/or RNA helicase
LTVRAIATSINIKKLLKEAIDATESEIRAVTLRPSRDMLISIDMPKKGSFEGHSYAFKTQNQSFQHVDELKVISVDPVVKGTVRSFDDERLIITFDKPLEEPVTAIEVEWINDYILRRTLDQLEFISKSENKKYAERLEEVLNPDITGSDTSGVSFLEDGFRNPAQRDAIQKSLANRVTFLWGPPGTGKTATLGFIIANMLHQGKKVLFASNTNRAVDVGLLSVLAALQDIRITIEPEKITRFGDVALDHDAIQQLQFDQQIEAKQTELREQLQPDREDVRRQLLLDTINNLIKAGKKVPPKLEYELELLGSDAESIEAERVEAQEELEMLPFKEIIKKQLVATTLARVCTSDLLHSLSFDAVVIDEASMAGIPYLVVLAAKSKKHLVFAGDPMQLPPISTTDSVKHRNFLEKDIYSLISNAIEMEDLFVWKDDHPQLTCFFDTQYRLNADLATIISDVFYDGRLKTGKIKHNRTDIEETLSVHVVDTSRYGAYITTKQSDGGFRPENEVHRNLVKELVRRLMINERVHPSEIGIIVPFRSVVWDYRKFLREEGYFDVEVGTIHTFQGREKHAIIFDSVMSGQLNGSHKRHYSVRPFDETKNGMSVPRLLNVAFSRAKEKLVILADMEHVDKIYKGMFLGNLLLKIRSMKTNN